MQCWSDLTAVPPGFGPSAVTIGNFDGVHRGHHAVLGLTVDHARQHQLQAVAVTFDPHPLALLYPDRAPEPLSTAAHKLELLAATGLDAVLVMPFTHELAQWSPRRFVRDVLVDALGARQVVVGRDTRFGYRNSGDVDTLRELGAELGFVVDVTPDLGRQGEERRWSSTWVRELIAAGDVAAAAAMLARTSARAAAGSCIRECTRRLTEGLVFLMMTAFPGCKSRLSRSSATSLKPPAFPARPASIRSRRAR